MNNGLEIFNERGITDFTMVDVFYARIWYRDVYTLSAFVL